jgi:hypothetical protein
LSYDASPDFFINKDTMKNVKSHEIELEQKFKDEKKGHCCMKSTMMVMCIMMVQKKV